MQIADFGRGQMLLFSCCALGGSYRQCLATLGIGCGRALGAFPRSSASSRVPEVTVTWSVEWAEHQRMAFHWSRFLQVHTDLATLGFVYFTQNSEFRYILTKLSKEDT